MQDAVTDQSETSIPGNHVLIMSTGYSEENSPIWPFSAGPRSERGGV